MGGQRRLESAAQRRAVNRRDNELVGCFDAVVQVRQPGLLEWLAELGDVGARDEGPALANQQHGLAGVVGRRFNRIEQTLPYAV